MRLFFALEIPGDARSQIDLVAENVRRAHPGGRSVPADNLHVTLYFAGTCGPKQIEVLCQSLHLAYVRAVSGWPPIFPLDMSITETGTFRSGRGRVLWLGVEPRERIVQFRTILCEELEHCGFCVTDMRPPIPHITIARDVPGSDQPDQRGKTGKTAIDDCDRLRCWIDGPSLMESLQLEGKTVYRPLCRMPGDAGARGNIRL